MALRAVRTRRGRIALFVILIILGAVAATVAGTSASASTNTAFVKRWLDQSLPAADPTNVSCPSNRAKVGVTFTCTFGVGQSFTATYNGATINLTAGKKYDTHWRVARVTSTQQFPQPDATVPGTVDGIALAP